MDKRYGREEISAMRRSYGEVGLTELPADPIEAFTSWLAEAAENPVIVEANAMVLSTSNLDGAISSRTVLLKGVDESGFTFYTNYSSQKGHEISQNAQVSLLFPWFAMERQVVIQGIAVKTSREVSESYFRSRPWSSQIGAWASHQSAPLTSREELENRWKGAAEKWPEGSEVPLPPEWGGYTVKPERIEFWQGRYSRLHDRLRFERHNGEWEIHRYYP
jgi:pyridoxamine 5'-phosphate oxidase